MEITILNNGLEDDAFHDLAAGEQGTALRKAAKDHLGEKEYTENTLYKLRQEDPAAFEHLETEMTMHALEVANLSQSTAIALRLNLAGDKKT
ncbi:hypothetical protein [Halomonas garicola]|uniref:hypothetical protein n=1 Tax=Halomonas garicola TaxID=1690008 RepID=UPI0028A1EAD1|nr:hypothetical protein [Halomonas garicola]